MSATNSSTALAYLERVRREGLETYFAARRAAWGRYTAELETAERAYNEALNAERCVTCLSIATGNGFGPSHAGSARCKSGSIASGGNRSHCTCDTCF